MLSRWDVKKIPLTCRYVGRYYIHMSQGLHEVVTDTSKDTATWIGSLLFFCVYYL